MSKSDTASDPEARPLQRAGMAASVPMARYAGGGWFRRHRRLCMAALIAFAFVYGAAYALFGAFFLLPLLVPLLVLAGLVVWLLPDTGRAPVNLLGKLMFAFLIALSTWPDYLALALPGLPWITAIRLTGVPMLVTLLICTSVSAQFRAEMKTILSAIPSIWKLLVVFIIIGFLSLPLSKHIGESISKFVVWQMTWTAVFFAAAYVFSRPGRVMLFGRILWGIVWLQIAIGVSEYRHSRVPWAGHIPSFLKIEDEGVQRILAGASRAATGIYRVQTRFTTSLGLGEFISFALPFIVHIGMTTRDWRVRLLGLVTLPPLFWLLLKTDSRLAIIGYFMTLLGYLLYWGLQRWRREKRSIFGPAIVLAYPALFTGFIAATFFVGRLRAIVWGNGAQQASTDTRAEMYRTGIPMVLHNPLGHGVGEGAITLGFYNGIGQLTIDTYYLAIALEYGIIGFLVYYAMFAIATWKAGVTTLRATDPEILYLAPLAIAMVNFIIIKSVFSQQENHPLVFAMLGMIVALVARQRAQDRQAPRPIRG